MGKDEEKMTNRVVEMNQKRKYKKHEIETILVSVIIGLVAAVGIIAAFAVFTSANIDDWNKTAALCGFFLLAGGITGVILLSD